MYSVNRKSKISIAWKINLLSLYTWLGNNPLDNYVKYIANFQLVPVFLKKCSGAYQKARREWPNLRTTTVAGHGDV